MQQRSGGDSASMIERVWLSRGPVAVALLPLAALFRLAVVLRRWLYRRGWRRSHRLDVPVLVVGNLIAGGAGKTPAVIAVAELLRRHGWNPGIVSRGYGRDGEAVVEVGRDTPARQCGDEPLLLHLRLALPVFVARRRVAAARALRQAHPEVDLIIADDGLQHLALHADVRIIVFDERGAGNGWLLPAGPLREPLPRTLPAGSLVLYNAPHASTPLPGFSGARRLAGAVALAAWRAGAPASMPALQALAGRRVVAAAGTARPGRFFDMLRAAGLAVVERPLPDHFAYPTLPWSPDEADVIVTEKDAVKLDPQRIGTTRVWVAPLDFRVDAAFEAALLAALAPES